MDWVFSFLLWPKREARGPWKQGRKKRGSITCPTNWANEANKMFIIWLCRLFRFWKGDRELEVRTATYGPGIDQSQRAKSVSHIIRTIIADNFQLKIVSFMMFLAVTCTCITISTLIDRVHYKVEPLWNSYETPMKVKKLWNKLWFSHIWRFHRPIHEILENIWTF